MATAALAWPPDHEAVSSQAATPAVTNWDQVFLKTLYRVDISNQRPRSLIARDMVQDIVGDPQP